ncbi:DoxX family protein [Croceitalea sp. MTPC9]|uniref:DoxX family protein n=1 Tax=unclassified Croceitalea TaxID=2632280 RepID=UPI002B3A9014|nr:DoxX family protein [Croceitalea sp. MTPC6]GMN15746.1 DoxX family protein [Croceitalea sp. MTPC9]
MRALYFPSNQNFASLFLRISIGGMFLLHGIGKPFIVGMDKVIPGFIEQGFPVWTAYFSTIVEIIGGMMLLVGLYSRIASIALMPISLGILFYHFPNGWVFQSIGGGWEYPQLIIVALVVIYFLGTGKYGITKT